MSTTTTTKPAKDAKGREDLSRLIQSPSARATLFGAGIRTLADARAAGMERLLQIPDIGDGTLELLRGALEAPPEEPEPVKPKGDAPAPKTKKPAGHVEEGPHPILLHSPYREYRFPLKKTRRTFNAATGEHTDETPLWVEFYDGAGKITALEWALRRHKGDEDRARADVENKVPWRVECATWLRARNGFPRDFAILGD